MKLGDLVYPFLKRYNDTTIGIIVDLFHNECSVYCVLINGAVHVVPIIHITPVWEKMKKYDLVKGIDFMCAEYGIGLVLAADGFGTLKVYWPKDNFWCLIIEKNVVKI